MTLAIAIVIGAIVLVCAATCYALCVAAALGDAAVIWQGDGQEAEKEPAKIV